MRRWKWARLYEDRSLLSWIPRWLSTWLVTSERLLPLLPTESQCVQLQDYQNAHIDANTEKCAKKGLLFPKDKKGTVLSKRGNKEWCGGLQRLRRSSHNFASRACVAQQLTFQWANFVFKNHSVFPIRSLLLLKYLLFTCYLQRDASIIIC